MTNIARHPQFETPRALKAAHADEEQFWDRDDDDESLGDYVVMRDGVRVLDAPLIYVDDLDAKPTREMRQFMNGRRKFIRAQYASEKHFQLRERRDELAEAGDWQGFLAMYRPGWEHRAAEDLVGYYHGGVDELKRLLLRMKPQFFLKPLALGDAE